MRLILFAALLAFPTAPATANDDKPPFWKHDWLFEVGIGAGVTRVEPDTTGDRAQNGMSMRVGLGKGVSRHFMLGVEVVGVLREGGLPDSTGTHSDIFLINNALTLHWRPFGSNTGPGTLHLRAGAGYGIAKIEYTQGGEVLTDNTDNGVGYLLGADYVLRIGSELAIGLSTTYSYLDVDGTVFTSARFLSTTLTIHWIPFGD